MFTQTTFSLRKLITIAILILALVAVSAAALQLPAGAQPEAVPVTTPTVDVKPAPANLVTELASTRPQPVAVATPEPAATQVRAANTTPAIAQSTGFNGLPLAAFVLACIVISLLIAITVQRRNQLTPAAFAR